MVQEINERMKKNTREKKSHARTLREHSRAQVDYYYGILKYVIYINIYEHVHVHTCMQRFQQRILDQGILFNRIDSVDWFFLSSSRQRSFECDRLEHLLHHFSHDAQCMYTFNIACHAIPCHTMPLHSILDMCAGFAFLNIFLVLKHVFFLFLSIIIFGVFFFCFVSTIPHECITQNLYVPACKKDRFGFDSSPVYKILDVEKKTHIPHSVVE